MKLIEGSTTESLNEIQKDVDYFLGGEVKNNEEKESKNTNPFSALFSIFKNKEPEENKNEKIDMKKIKKDSYIESLMRKLAQDDAKENCFNIFDIYKKTHGMASHDNPFE